MRGLFALVVALLLSACASTKIGTASSIESLLPGKWAMTTEINGARIEAETTATADGKVEERMKVTQDGVVTELYARGNWKVDGDFIVTTYTETNAPGIIPAGSVERDKVTFIDANQLSLVDDEGTAATMYRVR